jgi:hypothetical protein
VKSRLAAIGLLACLLSTPGPSLAADTPAVVSLRDPRITESSGLVDLGSSWVTTNDSGDSAQVFLVSPTTGQTIGISHFHSTVVDVEALAPAGRNAVWVGDIGDNAGNRKSVSVFKVLVGPGRVDVAPPRYRLVYPKGHPNAESLFVDAHGRLYVVTKSFTGGVVYRAPTRLSAKQNNRLMEVGHVAEFATDAALTNDGKHVIVRGPALARVYTVPGFQPVATFRLPPQPQGEGISVGPTGVVRVSSEGAHTAVRRVGLPAAVAAELNPAAASSPSPSPSPSASPSASPTPTPSPSPSPRASGKDSSGIGDIDPPWLMWSIPGVIAIGALGIGLGLRRRSE